MKLLFVCTGNTCRSPMAEGIYNAIAAPRGLEPATSAGLYALPGDPATPNSVTAAAEYGADLTVHRAQRVDENLLDDADRVYCMTLPHLAALCNAYPRYAAKCRLIGTQEIPDPYGGDLDHYRRTARAIADAVEALLREET